MKTNRYCIGKWSQICLLILLLSCGCSRQASVDARPKGKSDETAKFWSAFGQAAVQGTGVEVFREESWQVDVTGSDMVAVLEDIIAAEQARGKAIASLPVLNVAPEATDYAVNYAKTRLALVNTLKDSVSLIRQGDQVAGTYSLGGNLVISLLARRDEKSDGLFLRALMDTVAKTANDIQALRAPAKAVESQATATREEISKLLTDEMVVRTKLAERFQKEFPPMASLVTNPVSSNATRVLTEQQIQKTLIGNTLRGASWNFDSSDEFKSLKIISVADRSNVLKQYLVEMNLEGRSAGRVFYKVKVTYGRLYTRWKFISAEVVN